MYRNSANQNTMTQNLSASEDKSRSMDLDEQERELFEKLYESQKEIYRKLIALRLMKRSRGDKGNSQEINFNQAQSIKAEG